MENTSKNKKCRVCGQSYFDNPLIKYKNMPAAAQYLPDSKSLGSDKGIDLEVCQCSGCGLVQLSNNPVHYYKEVIRATAFSEEMKNYRLGQFKKLIQKYFLIGKKIIEIGCGQGDYLSLMNQCGADAYGLENSEESILQCRKNSLKVSAGFVENRTYRIENAPFDAFYLLNYLEHLPDPNTVLRGIYANVSDDAVGLVEVPNFDMILRKNLFSEFTGDHLLYFTRETLNAALAINGFETIECNEIWYDYIISSVVKKRRKIDLSSFKVSEVKLKNELQKFAARFKDKRVAIWGAGHQAFAVIAITNLSEKIKFVVDSALFKQGKYTPATHIPIVHPDILKSGEVDAVIVMAAGYSNEVAAIIKQKYGSKMHVAILKDYGLEYIDQNNFGVWRS
jgi:2-polyprenyl-3-methyl-5-hydroxy-6-metoxy-1,4-benzoquinol methylase